MNDDLKHLEALLVDMKESLEREMRAGFTAVNDRLDRVEGVLARHSGTILAGTVSIATLTKGLTKQEAAIRALDARVRKLESRRRNGKK